MRVATTLLVLLLIGLLAACGSASRLDQEHPTIELTFDTAPRDVSWEIQSDQIDLTFNAPSAQGSYVRLHLPAGTAVVDEVWRNAEDSLHLLIPTEGGAELGLVALAGASSAPVQLTLSLGLAPRGISQPPIGPRNEIQDLQITAVDAEHVELRWTEVNTGDYNFDGLVSISDLTPLGAAFGARVDLEQPLAAQTLYWIDGNRDGLIGINDLTAIGAGFGSSVAGYIVKRNGQPLPRGTTDLPTVLRSDGQQQFAPRLPNLYTITVEGRPDNNWTVEPVDAGLETGTGSTPSQIEPDLLVHSAFSGLSLFGNESGSGPGILRIIDPGEVVAGWQLPGQGAVLYLDEGTAKVGNLPRGVPLCLVLEYAPERDLATGQPRMLPPGAHVVPGEFYSRTVIPFTLPEGDAVLEIEADIAFGANPAGGYFVTADVAQTLDAATTAYRSRLSHKDGQLAYDSDLDGSFLDEPQLVDTLRVGLSDVRRANISADAAYASRRDVTLTGTLAAFDPHAGTLTLNSAAETPLGGEAEALGTVTLRLDELTGFTKRVSGEGVSDLDPFILDPGSQLVVEALRLTDEAQDPHVLRIARAVELQSGGPLPDSIYAQPAVTVAYPGQAVRVTVGTNLAANPLRVLDNVRLTYPESCRYKPGSFNIGVPGGEKWHSDGLWAQMQVATFANAELGQDYSEVSLGNGLRALDINITPLDGGQIEANATGVLFNFELIVNEDTALGFETSMSSPFHTAYFGPSSGPFFWTHADNAGQPMIRVEGQRSILSIAEPLPAVGKGTAGDPFVVEPEQQYSFVLAHPEFGDVGLSPDTQFFITPAAAGTITMGTLTVAHDFSGPFTVHATYQGIPNTDESTKHFYIGSDLGFELQLNEAATFKYTEPAGTLRALTQDLGDSVAVHVVADDVVGLKGLFFELAFNRNSYRYTGFDGVEAMENADARLLLTPDPQFPLAPVLREGRGSLRYGQAMINADLIAGFSGSARLVTLHFAKEPGIYAALNPLPPMSLVHRPKPTFNGDLLSWRYANPGDYNQNGRVGVEDLNPLGRYFYRLNDIIGQPFPETTKWFLIDVTKDGFIDLFDRAAIFENLDRQVSAYRVYASNNEQDYPDNGDLVETLLITQGSGWDGPEPQGDIEAPLLFQFNTVGVNKRYFWVKPVAENVEGAASTLADRDAN
jgi:hypothetical protein